MNPRLELARPSGAFHFSWIGETSTSARGRASRWARPLRCASKPSLFYSWMRGLFVSWSVVTIARLVDEKRGTRSFVRFLMDLKAHRHLITREWFVARWVEGAHHVEAHHARKAAMRDFDRCAGLGRATLSVAELEEDKLRLIEVCRPVLTFRHERVAHLSETPSPEIPRYGDLDRGRRY